MELKSVCDCDTNKKLTCMRKMVNRFQNLSSQSFYHQTLCLSDLARSVAKRKFFVMQTKSTNSRKVLIFLAGCIFSIYMSRGMFFFHIDVSFIIHAPRDVLYMNRVSYLEFYTREISSSYKFFWFKTNIEIRNHGHMRKFWNISKKTVFLGNAKTDYIRPFL